MSVTLEQTIAQRQQTWLSTLLKSQVFWVFVAIVFACAFLSFATNSFATPKNIYNITRNVTFTAIIALGMTMVIITGGIDLSVGSVLCLCSMVLAVTMHNGWSLEAGIAVAIVTALVVGAFNGVLIAYLGFPPFVVTLGMLSIARSLAMVASNNTVVYQFGPDHGRLLALGGGAWVFGIANPVLYTIVLALIVGFVLRWTKFGRHLYAIGGNEHAATLTGVPVRLIKVAVYMLSALSAGIAGNRRDGVAGSGHQQHRHRHGVAGDRRGGDRRRQPGRRRRHGVRRDRRVDADRGDPQQPRPLGHQRLLAGLLHRQLHHHCGGLRTRAAVAVERLRGLAALRGAAAFVRRQVDIMAGFSLDRSRICCGPDFVWWDEK